MRSGRAGITSETERLSYVTSTSARDASTKARASGLQEEGRARPRRARALVARDDPDRHDAAWGDVGGIGRVELAVERDVAVVRSAHDLQLARSRGRRERAGRREELEGEELVPALRLDETGRRVLDAQEVVFDGRGVVARP